MIIKPIKGHENHYVDEEGNVYRKMKPWLTSVGYPHVKLEGKHYDVHRLVAQEFVPNPNNLPIVNHIDENRENNHYTNLEWCTQQENIQHYLNSGGTPIKNFVESDLYKNGELIAKCKSVEEASKLAESMGASYSMIHKHRQHSGFEIKPSDNGIV